MEIGILGGSFDPVHQGHLYIVKDALTKGMDYVIIIPCYSHVYKNTLQDFDFRYNLCVEAFKELGDKVEISDVEKRINKEKNYTIDTLRFIKPELEEKFGEINLRFLMGSDLINEREKWKEWDEIVELAPPLVAVRKDYYPSSTILREKLSKGEIDKDLLAPSVVKILEKNNPYYKGEN